MDETDNPISQKPHIGGIEKAKVLGVVFLVLLSVSAGFLGGWFGGESRARNNTTTNANIEQGRQLAQDQSELISAIAKDVGPSVVSVSVVSQATQRDIFFGNRTLEQESAGTGFFIENNYVVTNRHVIPAGTSSVSLTMEDGTILDDVTVVGRTGSDDPLDVAFLKVNNTKGKTLKPAKIGNSSDMQVGDLVVAIGNALGEFQNTVTSGIISGYGRNLVAGGGGDAENLQNLFQTDAAINQGNSGGPLVNVNGEVIGINTAVAGGDAENIGFSIPINDIRGLIKSVTDKGKLERPILGVRYVQLSQAIAEEVEISQTEGAYIPNSTPTQLAIIAGSAAEKAGLREKDVILKVNEQKIDSKNTLSSVIGRFGVGEKVKLTIVRDGKEQTLEATLQASE